MDFSRIAPIYKWLEYFTFANALQRRRRAFLRDVRGAKNVLLLGDGDGRFAAAFLRTQNAIPDRTSHLEFLDGSAGMIRLARKRIRKLRVRPGTVQFRLEDARVASFSGPYDLVASHFFLDCFSSSELKVLVPRIAAVTTPDAKWLISEFAIPAGRRSRAIGTFLIRAMYLFFQTTTGIQQIELPDYGGVMAGSGFHLIESKSALGGLLVSQLWSRTPV